MIVSAIERRVHIKLLHALNKSDGSYRLNLPADLLRLLTRLLVVFVHCLFAFNLLSLHAMIVRLLPDREPAWKCVDAPLGWFMCAYMVLGLFQTTICLICCWKERVGPFSMLYPRVDREVLQFDGGQDRWFVFSEEGVGLIRKITVIIMLVIVLFTGNLRSQDFVSMFMFRAHQYPGEVALMGVFLDTLMYDGVTGLVSVVGFGPTATNPADSAVRTWCGTVRQQRKETFGYRDSSVLLAVYDSHDDSHKSLLQQQLQQQQQQNDQDCLLNMNTSVFYKKIRNFQLPQLVEDYRKPMELVVV